MTAALTDYMSMTTYRGHYSKTIELIDGVLTEKPDSPCKYRNGTSVTIKPSEKYLGPLKLDNDMIIDFMRNMSYIVESDIKIILNYEEGKGKKGIKYGRREFKAQGLAECCKYMSSSLETAPITAKYSCDDYDLTISFSYDKTLDDMSISSYCNYVITTEGGVHEIAATRAICEYLSREAKRQDPNSKLEITFDDCRKGLVLAVNLEHVAPKFEGQHKTKVSNAGIDLHGKKGLIQVLYNTMNNSPAILKKTITYLRQISKIRQEAHKIKGISVKKTTTFLEDAAIKKYFTTSNRNSTGYKEVFLCEGD